MIGTGIQNVHASNMASITIDYYDETGTLTCSVNDTINSLSTKGYWMPGVSCLPSTWTGSAVISSDQPIVAMGRPHMGSEIMTYNGVGSGNTSIYIPMLFNAAFGGSYNAAFYIQNLDPTNSADVTIQFYNSTTGALSCTDTDTLSSRAGSDYWLNDMCTP